MAAENEQKDYGKRIEYDPLWKGPLQEKRTRTDSKFLIAFGVFMLIWIAISAYALVAGDFNIAINELQDEYERNSWNSNNVIHAMKIGIGFSILAGIVSVIFIVLLRWYAKFMVYTAIAAICIGLLVIIIYVSVLSSSLHDSSGLIAIIVVLIIMLLVIIVCVCYFHKKINIACEIIREASKAVMFFPSSLAFPVLPNLFYILVTIFALIVLMNLLLMGELKNGNFEAPPHVYFLLIVYLFGFFWLCGFITGFAEMTLSGTFSTWYWTLHKAYVPKNTVLHCMGTTAKYHLGTVAFGSLIIAICQLINALLSYARDKLQQRGNSFTCFCFGWYQYLFQNLEQFVKFMSRGAFVMSAMHGTGFIQSTKDAFNLYMRNILKVIVTSSVTDGILVLGSLIAIGISTLATWGYCSSQNLDHVMPPAFVSVIFLSALISWGFFMVLKSAIDTIFLCVLEDYERNDGSEEKPYYMSLKIQSVLFKEQSENV
ncbi:hypothetical protein TSAR_008965 [Trichomalopsis sarcophagae]|uniref:Choline transporter-like protein n=1 Tax=Trichomalopsis sarcophagae TaxID=543379 RepID=A0A232EMF8_9HYME|nr:hypothetical protein TSAR_008965 [Trichomalopsis sarcophagae]